MLRYVIALVLFTSLASASPSISAGGIVNGASYVPKGFPNYGIAQGSVFVVFGSGMGPAALQQATTFPLPTQLAGTSIKATVNGTTTNAIIFYTSSGQVAALLPSSTPVGDGTLTVTYNGATSAPEPLHVVTSNFGSVTWNSGGSGSAVITFPNYSVVSLLNSAKPGDGLVLWGTGLGPVTFDETQPSPGGDMTNLDVHLYVGGQPAQILYRGRTPGSSGLDQINFVVPEGLSGCFVSVAVKVGSVVGNFASIPVSAAGGTCSDPVGPIGQVLQKVQSGQPVRLGLVQLSRFSSEFNVPLLNTFTINEDTGTGYFYSLDQRTFLGSFGVAALNSFESCAVWVCKGSACAPASQGAGATLLDAGSALNVTGPVGTKQLTKTHSGSYTGALGGGSIPGTGGPPDFLNPGSYTLSGPGGSGTGAVGSFTTTQSLTASPFTWSAAGTSKIPLPINRSQDLTINWTGGDPNGYTAIIGTSTSDATSSLPQVTATFGCAAKASAGHFTIPSWVLSVLPASGKLTQAGVSVPNGFVVVGNYPEFNPISPLPAGLDLGFFTNLVLSGENAQFQ